MFTIIIFYFLVEVNRFLSRCRKEVVYETSNAWVGSLVSTDWTFLDPHSRHSNKELMASWSFGHLLEDQTQHMSRIRVSLYADDKARAPLKLETYWIVFFIFYGFQTRFIYRIYKLLYIALGFTQSRRSKTLNSNLHAVLMKRIVRIDWMIPIPRVLSGRMWRGKKWQSWGYVGNIKVDLVFE